MRRSTISDWDWSSSSCGEGGRGREGGREREGGRDKKEREREERQESENTNKINQGKLCTIHLPFRQFADTAWLSLPQMLSPQLE